MAVYRQVHISFWQDNFVLSLTPKEKYFYLYLLTNSKTKQCGAYELPKQVIVLETGYPKAEIDKLLKKFIKERKIRYNEPTNEMLLLNWLKHNSFKSPKVRVCIDKELNELKYEPFKSFVIDYMAHGKTMDSLSIDSDSLCIDSGEEKEKEKEKEKPKKIDYAEHVKMTEAEHAKLVDKYGRGATDKMIEILDNYKGSSGKIYVDDYKAILSWVVDRYQAKTVSVGAVNNYYKPLKGD